MKKRDLKARLREYAVKPWYYRCADCHTLYVPQEGFKLDPDGQATVAMVAPPPLPTLCDHTGPMERWTIRGWEPCKPKGFDFIPRG